MAEKKVYGVFPPGDRFAKWSIVFNKKDALKLAKKTNARIRVMSYGLWNGLGAWDKPTFIIQSDLLERD